MSKTHQISRFPIPEINELPDDIKQILQGAQEHFGYVPNVMLALAHRPDELRAFMAYHNALINKESGMTMAEQEMLIVAFSGYNGCMYCVMSHGAALRLLSGNPTIADQIAINYREADITPRQKAMIDFAMKVTSDSRKIDGNDFDILRSHGFSDEDIWDIAGITAFYNMSNRMMSFLAVRPVDEFYKLGR
ncbi:MAG: alkylhydroperoxidase [Spartobacteria bacterium]|nr:alkylhydroperoxidase [Spartobacteria bacterium]